MSEKKVLVAEDCPVMRTLMRDFFSLSGITAIIASDGDEAWKKIESEAVDLVVTDYQMPGINGIDLIRKMRESSRHKRVPVVMLTGIHDPDIKKQALLAGANGFMWKPVSIHDFRLLISPYINGAAARGEGI